jgi:hypothetical protein
MLEEIQILVVGDGFGPSAVTLGRLCSSGNLTMDKYVVGTIRTRSESNLVTGRQSSFK